MEVSVFYSLAEYARHLRIFKRDASGQGQALRQIHRLADGEARQPPVIHRVAVDEQIVSVEEVERHEQHILIAHAVIKRSL